MKRVILFFGVIGIYSAAAQQKDVYDIHEYLKNKKAGTDIIFDINKITVPTKLKIFSNSLSTPILPYTLRNGDIIQQGAGKMPVIIPGNQYDYTMPNAATKDLLSFLRNNNLTIGKMPNAAVPPYFTFIN